MNTRRKFLVQGSLAATAVLAAGHIKSFAAANSFLDRGEMRGRKVVLIHTNSFINNNELGVDKLKQLRLEANVLFLHTSPNIQENASLQYDSGLGSNNQNIFNEEYKIVQKGSIRIGIINARAVENVVENTERLSAYLKSVKECQLIICISELGYQNNISVDDIYLSSQTSNVDIILSGHQTNFHKRPIIVKNKNRSEVIIHSASSYSSGFGKIEIEFDRTGSKKHINFNKLIKD